MILARALYSDTEIYLLDDPISAVDAKVAKQIFRKCIRYLSQYKTVILVSHQIGYIQECDEVIIMNEGKVENKGSPKELKEQLKRLTELK